MTVVFDGNDKKRFITAGQHEFTPEAPQYYILIKDISFWIEHENEIYVWMECNLPRGRLHQEGMVIAVPDESMVTAFLLRWG